MIDTRELEGLDGWFYHILGGLELLGFFVFAGLCGWFYNEYVKFLNKDFNPSGNEKTLKIDYNFDTIGAVFMAFSTIAIITYLVGGALFFSRISVNETALLLSTSIITGICSVILVANGGMSLENHSKIKKNYESGTDDQDAKETLQEKKIPYMDMGISSLVSGIVGILIMITLLSYFYLMYPKPPPSPPPPPPAPLPPQEPDYLGRRNLVPGKRVTFVHDGTVMPRSKTRIMV